MFDLPKAGVLVRMNSLTLGVVVPSHASRARTAGAVSRMFIHNAGRLRKSGTYYMCTFPAVSG